MENSPIKTTTLATQLPTNCYLFSRAEHGHGITGGGGGEEFFYGHCCIQGPGPGLQVSPASPLCVEYLGPVIPFQLLLFLDYRFQVIWGKDADRKKREFVSLIELNWKASRDSLYNLELDTCVVPLL